MIAEEVLAGIVGAGGVIHEPDMLEAYSRDMSFVNAIKPDCVVRPRHAADIEMIVRSAIETVTPLVPVSSGPPHFRGDTVPGIGGAIIVDLSGMKRIIRVDRANRVAMFEPGVTFAELIPAVAREGLRLNLPLLPRRSKSVAGSLLEREPVLMPGYHWDIADPLACVEIIFGTGDIFRTGAAAGPGSLEEQWAAGGAQKEAAGPSAFSLYRVIQGAQGTMGIVTWASVRCELLPELEATFLVGSADLGRIMELVRWLIRLRLVTECFVLNNVSLAAIIARRWPADYRAIKASLPPWVLFFSIAGYEYLTQERVSGQVADMKEIAQRVGVEPVQTIGEVSADELSKAVKLPSAEPYWKLRPGGACHDIFFLTVPGRLPGLLDVMYREAQAAGYPTVDMGIYLQPVVQGTSCHAEFNLFYNPSNRVEAGRIRELSDRAVTSLVSNGAFFSRPYGAAARTIINRDAATVAALIKVKSILDPGNIMNPGKLCF